MASEEVRGSFCRYDSCVITDQLATGAGALERELLVKYVLPFAHFFSPKLFFKLLKNMIYYNTMILKYIYKLVVN